MSLTLSIEENSAKPFEATVHFDGGEWIVPFHDPFNTQQENDLRWYFEKHIEMPMLERPRVEQASHSVAAYGKSLFQQLTADPDLYAALKRQHSDELRIEINGSPEFHRLHWESLWDPNDPQPFCHRSAVVRRVPKKGNTKIDLTPAPEIRVLVVVARPGESKDVGYRTISRPLVETVKQAKLNVQLEFVRPGSWQALRKHLDDQPKGYYHVLHFDGHGVVSTPAAIEKARHEGKLIYNSESAAASATDQRRAYLFFEAPPTDGHSKPPESGQAVDAADFANLINSAQIPIVILNACQSARQEKDAAAESNLASHLAAAGVRAVLAMAYSVTVSAARNFMRAFYASAFSGEHLSRAVAAGRRELMLQKRRSAYFGMSIDLEDWLLPVLYESDSAGIVFKVRATMDEERQILERSAARFETANPPPLGFWGRDLDILRIERRLLSVGNILLLEGMGGTGKSTLLQHLASWWQQTGLVDRVFLFEYDQKAWNRQQILFEIARQLNLPLHPEERLAQEAVAKRLRAERCLLILDNLESVTGEQLAVGQTLPEADRKALHDFLRKLQGGRTLVLVGSRSKEPWLAKGTFEDNVHGLRGLDSEARSAFGEEILRKARVKDVAAIRESVEYRDLLALLDGHPLAMQVVLNNLKSQQPAQVLKALREGDVKLDEGDGESKTESILRCIDYSHSNLSEGARQLLACFAPFTGVVFLPHLDKYVALLREQPELASLPWNQMPKILQEAEHWGLVREEGPFLFLQPVFPFFLRSRVEAASRAAIDRAFHQHYDGYCGAIGQMQTSKEPQQKQSGQMLAKLEFENVRQALDLALRFQVSIANPYVVMSQHYDATQNQAEGLALAERVMAAMGAYPAQALEGPLGLDFVGVLDDGASRFLLRKQFAKAQSAYDRALHLNQKNTAQEARQSGLRSASIHHQLGMVAQQQRKWAEAESHYREALKIKVEFQDRYSQAITYHQLGRVAQEQRKWEEAESHYREALKIKVEFQDRYSQASTYHQLGMVAQEQRKWEEAESHYRESLKIKVEFQDRYSQASTYGQLGNLAQAQRKWEEAESHYRGALKIFVEFQDRYAQASTYHQLGIVAQAQRKWEEAESHYRETLKIQVEFQDRYSQASTYHQLGMVAEEQRKWEEAESHYREALKIKVEFQDRYSQASTYGQLGNLAQEQRKWEEAESHYREALKIFVEFQDRYGQASTYHQLGMVAEEQRKWEDAESHYREALKIKVEFQDRYAQAGTYHQLGRVAEEQRKWPEAESHYLEALRIFTSEAPDQHNQGIVLGSLARLSAELPAVIPKVAEILGGGTEQITELFRKIREAQAAAAAAGSS